MSNQDENSGSYTLPEITIEGRADSSPINAADFFCDGFIFGWNQPDTTPQLPGPLRDELRSAYLEGTTAGRDARRAIEDTYSGPAVGPDFGGGESYEELERRWREAWSEFLNHREEPHIEPPEIEIVP